MDSPGPLETKATEAYYNVTLVDPRWTAKQAEEHLRAYNRYGLAIISTHEAYPGHYTNYLFNKTHDLSLIRKIEWNVAFGEAVHELDRLFLVKFRRKCMVRLQWQSGQKQSDTGYGSHG